MSEFSGPVEALVTLAERLGAIPMNKHAECWEHKIDDRWSVAFNAHREPRTCSLGHVVEPGHFYVEFNGWPAGVFNIYGGEFAAGSEANEETFCAAVRAAIEALPQ